MINILMSQHTVDVLNGLKEEFALTVKQAKANIFTSSWKAPSRRSINQDAARVDVLERPEELSVLVVRKPKCAIQ